MPPLNNKIHTYIQRVMLSFDDFSIKRMYKEKTVRIIKISLEVICILFRQTSQIFTILKKQAVNHLSSVMHYSIIRTNSKKSVCQFYSLML